MSALALRWLNDELKLRRRVESLERDLSNGYSFAEVLHLHGLESRLEEYRDGSTLDAKVHNMEMLGQTLERLNIPFPVDTRRGIMMENRSAILQFLLQLKDAVDGLAGNGSSSRNPTAQRHPSESIKTASSGSSRTAVSPAALVLPPRDVEERFIATTVQRLQPTEVAFRKDINMAVHLRKFEQAQWEAENKLRDFKESAKATSAAQDASRMQSVRDHLRDKRQFMKDWDHEHLEKWKETQRRHLQMERNDLRLELALQKRREIFQQRSLNDSRVDASQGVVEFEKNIARLGLGQGGAVQEELRAVPVDDEGAVAHFCRLERRVEELDFRPSSNIKMMKELKRRRKAQLAAEKDRQIRKQRAAADQKDRKYHEGDSSGAPASGDRVSPENPGRLSSDEGMVSSHNESLVYLTELYLQGKLTELEDNYDKLRKSGQQKRDVDMATLQDIRSKYAVKSAHFSQCVCADVVDRLVSLAYAIASTSCHDDDARQQQLTQEIFLHNDEDAHDAELPSVTTEENFEAASIASEFLCVSGHWTQLFGSSSDGTIDIAAELQRLSDEIVCTSTSSSWTSSVSASRVLVVLYAEDDSGINMAHRVAEERGLELVQLDKLLDECVKLSYDPQKLGDTAAGMPERERVLGVFGPKITALRQKSAPIPEVLTAEIVSAAISAGLNERGSLLLNFPRSVEEARLLETALLSTVENCEDKLTALETAFSPDTQAGESCLSAVDCVISIAQVPAEKKARADIAEEAEATRPPTASRPPTGKPRGSIVSQDSPEQQLLLLAEQRGQLTRVWERITHHFKIEPAKLHPEAILEAVHLSIDMLLSLKDARVVWIYEAHACPEALAKALATRRAALKLPDRFKLAQRSNEIQLESKELGLLASQLDQLDQEMHFELQRVFEAFVQTLRATTARCADRDEQLQRILHEDSLLFQSAIDESVNALASVQHPKQAERALTMLEVSLGDIVDNSHEKGSCFVQSLSNDPLPSGVRAADAVLQLVPLLFLYVKENALSKLELLHRKLYAEVPFLRDDRAGDDGSEYAVALSREVLSDAMEAAMALGSHARDADVGQAASEEMLRQLAQIACQFPFHVASRDASAPEQYSLHEKSVTAAQVTRMLQFSALLCRFAQQFAQSSSRLHARSIVKLRCAVRDDSRIKHERIAQVMEQREHILLPSHLLALVRAFRARSSAPLSTTAEFVTTVLSTAQQHEFPGRWRDAVAVARVALQQEYCSSSRGMIHWRHWVLSLLATAFVGLPTVEQMRRYVDDAVGARPAVLAGEAQARLADLELSAEEFWRLPLWFEDERAESTGGEGAEVEAILRELKQVMFQLFASPGTGQLDDAEPAASVPLLPMLLGWSAHPSAALDVHPKLASEFLPSYSRGLLRAFHALLLLGDRAAEGSATAAVVDEHLLSKMLAAAGARVDCDRIASTAASSGGSASASWTAREAAAFLRFCRAYDRDLERLLLLRNPFEAIAENSAASP